MLKPRVSDEQPTGDRMPRMSAETAREILRRVLEEPPPPPTIESWSREELIEAMKWVAAEQRARREGERIDRPEVLRGYR